MTREQIDEIAMRVWANTPTYATCDARKLEILAFTHALLAELAKVSEPVGTVVNKEGFLYHGQLDSKSAQLPDRSQLFTHPLPQPDLVAENEHKEWALLMNADIEQLREQLSAAQASDTELLKALEALVEFASRNVCDHSETYRGGAIWEICRMCGAKWADDEGGKPDFVEPREITQAIEAIATHKSRKE